MDYGDSRVCKTLAGEFESHAFHKKDATVCKPDKRPDFQSGHRKMCAGSNPVRSTNGNDVTPLRVRVSPFPQIFIFIKMGTNKK